MIDEDQPETQPPESNEADSRAEPEPATSEAEPDGEAQPQTPVPPSPEPPPSRWRAAATSLVYAVALGLALVMGVALGRAGGDEPLAETQDEQTMWTCSMHPQIRMDAPGQCPICGMDLVPAEGGAQDEPGPQAPRVTLSPRAQALARVATTTVERTEPRAEVRLLGRVDYDETRLHMVTPWTDGRIDRLEVRVTGSRVRKGQVVAQLYSPEVYAATRDLVLAAKQAEKLAGGMHGSGNLAAAAVSAAREKLSLLGLSDAEIKSIEKTRKAPKKIPIRSTFSGTILERNVEEGDYVKAGTALYHVADLSRVWVQIDAYESDLPYLAVGQAVVVEIDSLPTQTFSGEVAFIDPVVDRKTRTARVRVEVPNKERQLRPGMFAQAVIDADIGTTASHLVIPTSAVLFTGRRSVVYVAVPGQPGTFELREVRVGPRAGPVYPVLAGLSEGENVVSRAAFVVDADLQLQGGRSMMTRGDDRDDERDRVPVTPQMLAALEPVVTAYLAAQVQLAADDFEGARGSLETLATATQEVDLAAPRSTRDAWQAIATDLGGHGRHGAKAKKEGDVRAAFEQLSLQVISLLETFGNPTQASLRVAYCPMAFDNQGAQWVQSSGVVANPYYGASMPRCGDLEATIEPGERLASSRATDTPPPAAPMAGHDH